MTHLLLCPLPYEIIHNNVPVIGFAFIYPRMRIIGPLREAVFYLRFLPSYARLPVAVRREQ